MAPKKTTVPKTPVIEPVVDPIIPVEPVIEPPIASADETVSPMIVLEDKLSQMMVLFKEVTCQVRIVKKEIDRLRRIADRVEKKKASAKSSPNGFAKASKITEELCAFIGVPSGSERSRTDVTREIHKYVQANDLSDPKNKRIILAHKDAKLKALLGSTDKDEISYFNLQKYLKHHFIKPTPVVA